jgi:alpha-ketoglutarate-dependent taurine dioxygenase
VSAVSIALGASSSVCHDSEPGFPLRLEAKPGRAPARRPDAFLAWAAAHRDLVERALSQVGAVLLRGFAIPSAEVFQCFAAQETSTLMTYRGGNSPRQRILDRVYTSTAYPADATISLHNEMSYAARWPERLYFYCQEAPREGGETPVADSRRVLQAIPPSVRERFTRHGVRYVQNLHGGRGFGRSWQETFETDRREVVERHCSEENVALRWTEAGGLHLEQRRGAVAIHPKTLEAVWFNQAEQWHPSSLDPETREMLEESFAPEDLPLNALYGNGQPIPDADMDAVRDALRREERVFAWRTSDLLLVDNLLVAHGRRPFRGPRTILVAMGA